jgi:2-amino-4-hydroxy-6-hydroxymethyldihydropteridine diphosphokinase
LIWGSENYTNLTNVTNTTSIHMVQSTNNIAFIGIGSNQGDRRQACMNAVHAFDTWERGSLTKVSSLYESEPWGYEEQNWFINCVIKIATKEDALGLLAFLQDVEQRLGKQKEFHWGPRTIDLDLLFFNQSVIDEPRLKVPHPHLHERRFVLEALTEIEPSLIHPVLNQPVSHLLHHVQDTKKVFKLMEIPR